MHFPLYFSLMYLTFYFFFIIIFLLYKYEGAIFTKFFALYEIRQLIIFSLADNVCTFTQCKHNLATE